MVLAVLATHLCSACAPCPVHSGETEEYRDGLVSATGASYQTTAPGEAFLPFPSGQTYDLYHGLGEPPSSIHGYVSFVPRLEADGDPFDHDRPNNVAETAGNQMVIERWDEELIRIRNDTCADLYVRVIAYADPPASMGLGAAGAGAN